MPSASGETQDTETGGGKGITERNYSLLVLAVLSSSDVSVSLVLLQVRGERYCLRVTTDVDTDVDTETDEGRRQERERENPASTEREREKEKEKTWGNERETGNDREESSFETDASI